MEWPSFEQLNFKKWWPEGLWPKKMSSKELKEKLEEEKKELDKANDELRRAGNYGRRKGEDLVSKEEITKALEGEGAKPAEKIFSPKESAKKIREIREKLEEKEKGENKKKKKL